MGRPRKISSATWRSRVKDIVKGKDQASLAISKTMQIPICYLRSGLTSLMGESRTATVSDLVYFLLHAGSGGKDALMMAARKAGADGEEAQGRVEEYLAKYSEKIQGGRDRATGRPEALMEGQPIAIGGLVYAFPALQGKRPARTGGGAMVDGGTGADHDPPDANQPQN
ncbi:unnamed protein product, partial [Closterium sp. Naga37s-1]